MWLVALAVSAAFAGWSSTTIDGEKVEYFEAGPASGPSVLLFHNNFDGVSPWIQEQARKLGKLGYRVIAPKLSTFEDFGGVKDATRLTKEQRAEGFRLAGRRAAAALKLAKGPTAAVGYCHLGGPAAMDLARQGAAVKAVAALWGGVTPSDLSTMWGRRAVKAKILVLLGGSDVETNPYLASFQEEMRQSKADWRLVLYGKATHAFTIPGPHPDNRGEYDPEADKQSWRELTAFLDENLRR